jgi:ankyrin repeat protein
VQALCERWGGDREVINWAHPGYGGTTPLNAAWDSPEITAILLGTPSCEVNKGDNDGKTPLWRAALNGQPETVQALLAAPGIDLNKAPYGGVYYVGGSMRPAKGKSPLTISREKAAESEEGYQDIVRLLERAGARPSKGGKIKTRNNKRSKKNKRKTSNLYRRRI